MLAVGLLMLPTVAPIVPPATGLLVAGLGLVAASLAFVSMFVARPPEFVVDPRTPALRTLPHPSQVWLGVALVMLTASQAWQSVWLAAASHGDPHIRPILWATYLLEAVAVSISAVYLVIVWRGFGVRLEPHALVDQYPAGRRTVPWEALAPGYPELVPPSHRGALILRYARPELVRRRGLVPRKLQTHSADPRFVGYAIAYYVDHPEERATIGTREGYERLLRALGISAAPARR